MKLLTRLLRGAAAALTLLAATAASAQTYPSHLMTMIVPYPAGGPSDFVARQIQPDLGKLLGQQMIVDNVGGVSGALGIQKMLSAPADGHTITLASPMEMVLAPLALSAVKFKPDDLRLAGLLVRTPMVLLGRKDLPAKDVDELVHQARQPGAKELSYASVGPGSLYHIAGEAFARQTGLKMLHVPYKGAAPIMTDLMGGQIDLVFVPLAGSVPSFIQEGKVKCYGIAASKPHPLFPSYPVLTASKGLAGFEFETWAGIAVPKATPDDVVAKLNKAVYQALQNPDVRKAFESTGNTVAQPAVPAELNKLYAAEIARYQTLAKTLNVQPQ